MTREVRTVPTTTLARGRQADEQGIAMITAILASVVVMALSLTAVGLSRHNTDASSYDRARVQAYEGVVIAKRNRGLNSSFIVRKISSGEGVERTFQTYSPLIASIEVKRRGDVGRAKLYYLRQRTGKAARIREKLTAGGEDLEQAAPKE